jgi:hypothetical protein
MTTITKTTASAISRKLTSLGFDKYDGWAEYGFTVFLDGGVVTVSNRGSLEGTAALELSAAGYIIENLSRSEGAYTGVHKEIFTVAGRVEA